MKAFFQSIRIKLILLLLAVGLIPLLVGTLIFYFTSTEALMEKVGHELQLEADHVAFAVETTFAKIQTDLLLTTTNPAFTFYFEERSKQDFWRLEQEKAMLSLQDLFPNAQIDCSFTDTTGRLISRTLQNHAVSPESPIPRSPLPPIPELLNLAKGETYQGAPFVSGSTHLWSIPFIIPVFDQGRRLGFIRLDINLEYFSRQLRGNISPDNHAFILERTGRILAQKIISIGETADLLNVAVLDSSPLFRALVARAIAGKKNREFLTTTSGRKYLVAYQPAHSGIWSILVFMPRDNAVLEVIPSGRIPLIFAGTFIIIVILALLIGERISDPIKRVVSGTRTLSSGDFSHRIHVLFKDELGELGHAFNAMAEHLQKREEEILRRNRELSSLNIIATTVNQSLGLEESLNGVLNRILDVTGTRAGGIYLLKEKHTLQCIVHAGVSKKSNDLFHPQKAGEGWVGLVAKSPEPLIWNETPEMKTTGTTPKDELKNEPSEPQEKPGIPIPEEIVRAGFKSYIGIPLKFKNKVNGVVCLLGDTSDHFDPAKVEFLSSICSQIGVSIENALLFANLEQAYEELKEAHSKLVQSAKLAAVGELAAGVAHELNQPLMVIRGYTQEILENNLEGLPESLQDELKKIENQTTRMMRIIGHLRAFARQSSGLFELVDLNEVVQNSFTLVTQQLKTHNIIIVRKLGENIPKIWGDPTRLEQVFLNLITNARDAMEYQGGGTLTVITRALPKEKGGDRPASPGVEVVFSDTGSGISQKNIDKVFDPFFTTKEVGKGTGLGLSIGYSIVKDHGGSIRVESQVDVGTSFILHFPIEKRRTPRRTAKTQETSGRRHEHGTRA